MEKLQKGLCDKPKLNYQINNMDDKKGRLTLFQENMIPANTAKWPNNKHSNFLYIFYNILLIIYICNIIIIFTVDSSLLFTIKPPVPTPLGAYHPDELLIFLFHKNSLNTFIYRFFRQFMFNNFNRFNFLFFHFNNFKFIIIKINAFSLMNIEIFR